jgi:imidazole glycerol-phosphate synthase subunit HisF
MLRIRVIPCLLLSEGGLIKTVKFDQPKYIGDPINAVKIFNDKEVDELIFLDIDASKKKGEPDYDLIAHLATECFMPFSYGGGVSSIEQIKKILRLGVEKVVINYSALQNLDLIKSASVYFGSSTIIGAVDVKKDFWGGYKVYDHVKKKTTTLNPIEHVKALEQAGVGEIFLNNVDRDGTFKGLDHGLISSINKVIKTPLIVCGGVASVQEIKELVLETSISAVAAGSLFVFQGPHRAVLISYPTQSQIS